VSLNVHYKYNLLIFLIMKKSILNLGKALNKTEQKSINGGRVLLGSGDGLLGRGSLCVRTGTLPHTKCKPGLTCKSSNTHTTGVCG
jgi:hypothetical protein